MTTDHSNPIQPGKPIVIGQAAILWGDAFMHPDRGPIAGGWILPGCVRTTNGEHASRVCRELNESIKAITLAKKPGAIKPEDLGDIIKRQLTRLEG